MFEMTPSWRDRFAAMQARAREMAEPRSGERLHSFRDLLANPDLPDGTQMDEAFMKGIAPGARESMLLKGINAYVDFPNFLRRRTTDDGFEFCNLSPERIQALRQYWLAEARNGLDADLPVVGSFHG